MPDCRLCLESRSSSFILLWLVSSRLEQRTLAGGVSRLEVHPAPLDFFFFRLRAAGLVVLDEIDVTPAVPLLGGFIRFVWITAQHELPLDVGQAIEQNLVIVRRHFVLAVFAAAVEPRLAHVRRVAIEQRVW